MLERLARMRTAQAQAAARARILLLRDSGETLVSIAEKVGLAVNSVRLCVTKYLEGGVEHALSDDARSGRPREIDDADRAFVAEDSLPDAAQHPGLQQRRARGEDPALPRGGERRVGRLQMEVEPVGRRPDDRGARRGHPPFGWGRQGTLVAGRFTRRGTDRTPAGPIALGAATAWTGPVLRFRSRLGSPPARFQNHSTIAPV